MKTTSDTAVSFIEGGVCAPAGFIAGGVHCGIRRNKSKLDLCLIYSQKRCNAAAVYTTNKVFGAPITVTRQSLADGEARAVVCNSGIANTCSAGGVEKALEMRSLAAKALGIGDDEVIIASTGVIGMPLDTRPVAGSIGALAASLSPDGSDAAARAIMTTDTRKKEYAVEYSYGGKTVRIGAIAKGSGMICPNMATMLCFMTTDAAVSAPMLQKALRHASDESFNMLSIDGDTSTNDMLSIMANGLAGNAEITAENAAYFAFREALTQLSVKVASEMARDGEGATKLIICRVQGAAGTQQAKKLAKSVIGSALVKTAMFGADANWGRVICAMGYSGADFNAEAVDIAFISAAGRVAVCKDSAGTAFSEKKAKQVLSTDEIIIEVTLREGSAGASAFGCDFSYDYVKINGDYRT